MRQYVRLENSSEELSLSLGLDYWPNLFISEASVSEASKKGWTIKE